MSFTSIFFRDYHSRPVLFAAKQQISWIVSLWRSPLTFVWPGVPKQWTITALSSQSERHLTVFCIHETVPRGSPGDGAPLTVPDYVVYHVNWKHLMKSQLSGEKGWPLQLEIGFDPTALSYSSNFLNHQVHLTCTIAGKKCGFKKLDILNLHTYEYSDKNYCFNMSLVPDQLTRPLLHWWPQKWTQVTWHSLIHIVTNLLILKAKYFREPKIGMWV